MLAAFVVAVVTLHFCTRSMASYAASVRLEGVDGRVSEEMLFPINFTIFAVIFLCLAVFVGKEKPRGRNALLGAGFGLLIPLVAAMMAQSPGMAIRDAAFQDLAIRSRPLVRAIHSYAQDNSAPPAKLDDLVPEYLLFVPRTGLAEYPTYVYDTGPQVAQKHAGNSWILYVETPISMGSDQFVFYPNQQYPNNMPSGGSTVPMGDWAYVRD